MAGGPHAAVIPCMACQGKAVRVVEGYESDQYLCEACGLSFGMDWRGEPLDAPWWPPPADGDPPPTTTG